MNSGLPEIFQGLPQSVRNMNELRALLRRFGNSTFFFKNDFKRALKLIEPDELLYYINSNFCTIRDRAGNKIAGGSAVVAVLFFSNKRFFAMMTATLEVFQIPLNEIHSVASTKGRFLRSDQISFCTLDKNITFTLVG